VNVATVVAFVVAALFAVGDWIAKWRHQRALEYVCKPATLLALTIAAIALDPASDVHTRRVWFVVALIASLKGDILLMADDLFVFGLAAFLVGHLCYLAGFWTEAPAGTAFMIAAVVVAVAVAPLARRILRALHDEPVLRIAVVCYMTAISAMLATALATGNVLAGLGAALFVTSDAMIAWSRFVRPREAPGPIDVAIMVTYHLGQAGLVASLLR
jgi:uncharacterized membrane protein YhhN